MRLKPTKEGVKTLIKAELENRDERALKKASSREKYPYLEGPDVLMSDWHLLSYYRKTQKKLYEQEKPDNDQASKTNPLILWLGALILFLVIAKISVLLLIILILSWLLFKVYSIVSFKKNYRKLIIYAYDQGYLPGGHSENALRAYENLMKRAFETDFAFYEAYGVFPILINEFMDEDRIIRKLQLGFKSQKEVNFSNFKNCNLSNPLISEFNLIPQMVVNNEKSNFKDSKYELMNQNRIVYQDFSDFALNDDPNFEEFFVLKTSDTNLYNGNSRVQNLKKEVKVKAKLNDLESMMTALNNGKMVEPSEQNDTGDQNRPAFNKKSIQIVKTVIRHGDSLGFTVINPEKSIVEDNENFAILLFNRGQNTTDSTLKSGISKLKRLTGLNNFKLMPSKSNQVKLQIIYKKNAQGRHISMDEVKTDSSNDVIDLGATATGDYVVAPPRNDEPLFLLLGGLSRSGKSTLGNRIITSLLYLKTQNNYDYQDVFIASVKPEDYIANGLQESGAYVAGNAWETYEMLSYIDQMATARKDKFLAKNTINIKQFNKISRSKMGKILVVLDEYANTIASAKGQKIETPLGKLNLSDEIERLAFKIAQEHGSRGVNMLVITQKFNKDGVGQLYDALGSKILGYAPSNVWNSIDNSQEMSGYLKDLEDDRKGLFFVNAPDFRPTSTNFIKFNNGFTQVNTHFLDTDEIRDGLDRKFNTADNFQSAKEVATTDETDDSDDFL